MDPLLTAEELEILRGVTTPTIANAIERFHLRGPAEGATDGTIKCVFPGMRPVIGYAVTLAIRSAQPNPQPQFTSRQPYWEHILKYPAPRLVVAQDLDQPPAGAYWGEVNSSIHWRLGCAGVITDGTVRDLDEVRMLGFPFLAAGISVTHAHCHLEAFDLPVTVGGMRVNPGDLVHADQHGAVVIPREVAHKLLAAVRAVELYERPIIQLCKSPDFSLPRLADLLKNETI